MQLMYNFKVSIEKSTYRNYVSFITAQ
jgi:hypothetical protein